MMRALAVSLVVLAVGTTPAGAQVWWGTSGYYTNAHSSSGYIHLQGEGGPCTSCQDISMRFTAKRNVTGIRVVKLQSWSGEYTGAPGGSVSVCSDDGTGNPGAVLGTSPITAIGSNVVNAFTLVNPVNLTGGTIYHVRITGDPLDTGADKVRIAIMPVQQAYDEHVEYGNQLTDPNMTGLWRYVYTDSSSDWSEGRPGPGEAYMLWEPFFGLYDEQGTGLYGEGARCGYDRLNSNTLGFGQSFLLQDLPTGYEVAPGKVQTNKLRFMSKKKGSPTSNLIVKLLDAANNELGSASIPMASVVDGWNVVSISPTVLSVGQRYSIVALSDGSGTVDYSNYVFAYKQESGAVPAADLFQGSQSYSMKSTDGGVSWTTDDTKDNLVGIRIPEPATLGLLALGGLALLRRKRGYGG